MKTIIAYYSRTGITKKLAEYLQKYLKCDIEEIIDLEDRSGAVGYLIAGKDAALKKQTRIRQIKHNPADYDLVIIGTPVWAFTMCPAIRTYLIQNKDKIKKAAFFCTMGGLGDRSTFKDMESLCEKDFVATLTLKTKEVLQEDFSKVSDFLLEI